MMVVLMEIVVVMIVDRLMALVCRLSQNAMIGKNFFQNGFSEFDNMDFVQGCEHIYMH